MSDERMLLERVAERVTPAADSFERVARRRDRRRRDRAVVGAALAFAVAVAGSLGAYVALRGSQVPRVGAEAMLSSGSFDPAIRIAVQPHARLVMGSTVEVTTQLHPGQRLYAGTAYDAPCPTISMQPYAVSSSGTFRFSAQHVAVGGCPHASISTPIRGWVFAFSFRHPFEITHVKTFPQFLARVSGKRAIDRITVVPVTFVSAKGGTRH